MKAIADIYASTANAEKAQADGIWIGGDRYVVATILDRSIYARKVRQNKPRQYCMYTIAADSFASMITGQARCLHRQDQAGHPRGPPRRGNACWQLQGDRRELGRLPHWRRLLRQFDTYRAPGREEEPSDNKQAGPRLPAPIAILGYRDIYTIRLSRPS